MSKKLLLPILLFLCFVAHSQVNLSSGLMGYFPFNGNTLDASGNGNNAINFGATLTTDQNGNPNSAYYFDGSSNYMRIPNNATLNPVGNQVTLCARVQPTGFYTGGCQNNIIICKNITDGVAGNYSLRFTPTNTGSCTGGNTSIENFRLDLSGGCNVVTTVNNTPYIQLNSWYCLVGVYDGNTIKMFVNGVLRYQCTPSITIGTNANDVLLGMMNNGSGFPYWFHGKMDEVRLYNRALNAQEIDTLCLMTPPSATTTINSYAAVLSRGTCDNSFTVDDASNFYAGDTLLMIQMKGASIDSSNTAAFGNVLAYNGAGNYEYNIVKARTGNVITLKYRLAKQYDIPNGKVQLVRVPYYQNYVITQKHVCAAWDGSKGGVFVLNTSGTLTLGNDIDVSGAGFKGGIANSNFSAANICNIADYALDTTQNLSAQKGEGIANISISKSFGRGHLANGGGGGNSHNTGGGGGSNGSIGGQGGNQWSGCSGTSGNGIGGLALPYSTATGRLFMGGGGGAGHANELGHKDGGNGGGIIIINAGSIIATGGSLTANGGDAPECTAATTGCDNDGTGGGGGGGTIALQVGSYTGGTINTITQGGKGANVMMTSVGIGATGPGGGGAGGVCWTSGASTPAVLTINTTGGMAGMIPQISNTNYGATGGTGGISVTGLQITFPLITDTFKINHITAGFIDSFISCDSRKFVNQTTTTTLGIASWSWNFGDGFTSALISPTHTYAAYGTYQVKLIAVDSNGCKDSLAKAIVAGCKDTVINKYAAILTRLPCDNSFVVDTATGFNAGDTVLMIQMKGAITDTTNTPAFGSVLSNNGAGNYEYNVIKTSAGNIITLKYKVARQYDIPNGKVQFVRVPNYQNYTITQSHSCMPWSGSKGGVFIVNVANTLTLNAGISVNGKGFTGGQINNGTTYNCNYLDYFYALTSNDGGQKGEGIATVSAAKMRGKGRLANGGGGGNNTNGGGGGGANAGIAGTGGHQWAGCDTSLATGGIGGGALSYGTATNRLYLGGGGGAGHENNADTDPAGNGAGIIIINATNLAGNGYAIKANGADCINSNALSVSGGDGQSGGGAGGTLLLKVNNFISAPLLEAKGGNGGNIYVPVYHGPGGGGSGGAILFGGAALPAANISTTGGVNGTLVNLGNYAHDALPGQTGVTFSGMPYIFPADTFRANVITPGFTDVMLSCFTHKLNNVSSTTTTGLATYLWDAGVAGTSTVTSPTFTFPDYGTYPVKLIAVDSNGCKDSAIKDIIIPYVHFANAGNDTTTCLGVPTMLHASGGVTYSWSPVATLGTPNAATTTASPNVTTTYIVAVTNLIGCPDKDTAIIVLVPGKQILAAPHDTSLCPGKTLQLSAGGVTIYRWSPGTRLSDTTIANPVATFKNDIVYHVTGKDSIGCTSYDSVHLRQRPNPNVTAYTDGTSEVNCITKTIQLHAGGAAVYTWEPSNAVSNPSIASPTTSPLQTTTYTVRGTDIYGCIASATITILANVHPVVFIPDAFTPNGDGKNDVVRPRIFCDFVFERFEIYNRWGQSVFVSYRNDAGWDGNFKGRPADLGTYMWLVNGHAEGGGSVMYKGDITLIR